MQHRASFPLFALILLAWVACTPAKPISKTPPKPKTSKPTAGAASTSAMRFRYGVVDDAERFIGSPYKYAGRDPKTGFDCSGFTHFVLGRHQILVSTASSMQGKEGREVPLDKVKPGDLVFFGQNGNISHVALVVERSRDGIVCIHSTTSRGVIKENVHKSTYWKPRIMFARDVISQKRP